jgi:hypothetical protein
VAAALLMLVPQTRFLGALLIIVSFFFIGTHIRLALLCQMVMLCGILFFHPGSAGDYLAGVLVGSAPAIANTGPTLDLFNQVLPFLFWTYLILLPLAYFGIYYNFFARKPLPQMFQRILEAYTNFFGIIMWRVFTIDLINFYPNLYRQPRAGGERELISRYGWRAGSVRYSHVGESITLTCVFTTLKYYPSKPELFVERLLRYARTVPCPADSVLVFEYIFINKTATSFESTTVSEYLVDLEAETVTAHVINPHVNVHAAHDASPLHEGARPGSYVPLSGESRG